MISQDFWSITWFTSHTYNLQDDEILVSVAHTYEVFKRRDLLQNL